MLPCCAGAPLWTRTIALEDRLKGPRGWTGPRYHVVGAEAGGTKRDEDGIEFAATRDQDARENSGGTTEQTPLAHNGVGSVGIEADSSKKKSKVIS